MLKYFLHITIKLKCQLVILNIYYSLIIYFHKIFYALCIIIGDGVKHIF